jgi:WD domain, G-beta repeat
MSFAPRAASAVAIARPRPPVAPVRSAVLPLRSIYRNVPGGHWESPDGTRFVSGNDDKTVRVWDAATGQQVGDPLTGRTAPMESVAFSPDGTCIASGSFDKTVRLWDAATGHQLGDPLTSHVAGAVSVAYSPDGTRIVSGGWDKTLRLWPVYRDAVSALCAKLAANMSRQQWRDWVSTDIAYIEQCPGLPIPTD